MKLHLDTPRRRTIHQEEQMAGLEESHILEPPKVVCITPLKDQSWTAASTEGMTTGISMLPCLQT